jgi:hypothetical protein
LTLPQSSKKYNDMARASLPKLYLEALELFERLNPTDEKLKELRKLCPCLDNVTSDLLKKTFAASDDLAEALCERVPDDMHSKIFNRVNADIAQKTKLLIC